MHKEHLLAELNASVKELDKYKQNNPKAVPPKLDGTMVSNINEIDFDYVIGLGYNLPTVSLSTNSTLEEIENALFNIGNTDTLPSELLKRRLRKNQRIKTVKSIKFFRKQRKHKDFCGYI